MTPSLRTIWLLTALVALFLPGVTTAVTAVNRDTAQLTCLNLLTNSNMESNTGWVFGPSPSPGGYSLDRFVSPVRSARLGITTGPNVNSFSSMRQTVIVPAVDQLRLQLQVYPISQPPDPNDEQEIRILDPVTNATLRQVWSAAGNDATWKALQFDLSAFLGRTIVLYINVRNNGSGGVTAMYVDDVVLEACSAVAATPTPTSASPTPTPLVATATPTPTPLIVTDTPTPIVVTNTPTPTPLVATATPTPTPLIVTDTPTPIVVTNTPTPTPLVVTATPTPTPLIVTATPTPIVVTNTPTPTPLVVTATPTPTPLIVTATPTPGPAPTYTPVPSPPGDRCQECLVNGGFEAWGGWTFGQTTLQGSFAAAQAHSGLRSVVLGNPNPAAPNYISYSSVRQKVTLPRGVYKTASLEFWHYTQSDGETGDYQEAVILDGRTGRTLAVLWRVNRNDRTWRQERIDLTRYLGRTITVYFNVYNNGGSGRAAMYLDDVSLTICADGTVGWPGPPTFAPPPAETPAIVTTATPTPTPPTVGEAALTPTPDILATIAAYEQLRRELAGATAAGAQPGFWNRVRSGLNLLNCLLVLLLLVVVMVILVLLIRIIQGLRSRPAPP